MGMALHVSLAQLWEMGRRNKSSRGPPVFGNSRCRASCWASHHTHLPVWPACMCPSSSCN